MIDSLLTPIAQFVVTAYCYLGQPKPVLSK